MSTHNMFLWRNKKNIYLIITLYLNLGDGMKNYHTFTRKYVYFAYLILTWLSSTYHLWSTKSVIMGHVV